jgi:cell wall-associated NlpC family hydrolase
LAKLPPTQAGVSEASIAATPKDGSASADDLSLIGRVRGTATDLVSSAMNFLGVPYRRGGRSAETGFDCSGFTRHVFEHTLGLLLPHRADDQARLSTFLPIRREELKPGDLVFFNTMRRTFSHVGIYVGAGQFIHSPRAGGEVRVEDMRIAYWARRYTGARRLSPAELAKLSGTQTAPQTTTAQNSTPGTERRP